MTEIIHECCGKDETECTCDLKCLKCGERVGEENSRRVVSVRDDGMVTSTKERICFNCLRNSKNG